MHSIEKRVFEAEGFRGVMTRSESGRCSVAWAREHLLNPSNTHRGGWLIGQTVALPLKEEEVESHQNPE